MIQETSLLSYEDIQPKLGKRQMEVFGAIRLLCEEQNDVTDQEIREYLGEEDPNYVRPRRYELVNKHKKVRFSKTRRCKVTGKIAMAWKPIQKRL